MTTPKQIKANSDRLRVDLAAIEGELTQARNSLQALTGKADGEPKQAETLAARIMILDARRGAVQAALEKNEKAGEHIEALKGSKEYKDAVKKMAELERYFLEQADDVHAELILIRERLAKAGDAHAEYSDLVKRYCLDLDTIARSSKIQNKDYMYLMEIGQMLNVQFKTEEFIKALGTRVPVAEQPKKPQPKKPEYFIPEKLTA